MRRQTLPTGRDRARPLQGEQQSRVVYGGVRLGCGFRQPNSETEFGASVKVIGPYAPRGDEGRHAGSSCPTGGCGEPPRLPWVAAHSGASAAAGAREGAGIDARTIPKGGPPPAPATAALSEAESAERVAGQIRSLPDTLRVQHGAESSEVSAKPRPCSRRGCIDWVERFRAASRCAAGRVPRP